MTKRYMINRVNLTYNMYYSGINERVTNLMKYYHRNFVFFVRLEIYCGKSKPKNETTLSNITNAR